MNNSINYSGFVEMFLESGDDYEPYGCLDTSLPAMDGQHTRSTSAGQWHDETNDDS